MSSTSALETPNFAPLDITVILCTYNRCEDLPGVLETIAKSEMATSITWEVLVVDNNSTDQTRDVVEGFCHLYPGRFRYLFEPKAGKSYGLNTGVANAFGEVLAFVDDDVTVEPTWLQNLTSELHHGDWAGAAGRILPAQKFTPPPWLPPSNFPILYAHFDLGDQPSRLSCPPYGANMAFRREMFGKYGGFRTDLGPGPDPETPRPNEDTEFGRRLMAAGEKLRYEPSAVVYHPIPQSRITKEYFFSWWYDYGRATIREIGERPDAYGIPRDYLTLLRCALAIPVTTLRSMLAIHPHKRFNHKCRARRWAGEMVELYRRSVNRKRSIAAPAHERKSEY